MKKILLPITEILKNSKENIIQNTLSKFDIVDREEFEIQKKILFKTRQKLESLESKFDQILEKIDKS